VLCEHTHHFGITSKLQELMCLLAQGYVFGEAQELLQQFLGIDLCAKQIQRVSEHYGGELEAQLNEQVSGRQAVPVLPLKTNADVVYVMLDGSLIFTREVGWKEIKVGRLFQAFSRVQIQAGRKQVLQSLYVCHVGSHRGFLQKLEAYAELYLRKVLCVMGKAGACRSGANTPLHCNDWSAPATYKGGSAVDKARPLKH
jgi:hypothetical protein